MPLVLPAILRGSRTEQIKCMRRFWGLNHDFLNPSGLPIKNGDFGVVDKETGSFQREGNIFEHPDVKNAVAGLDAPIDGATLDYAFKRTDNVWKIDLPVGVGAGLTGIVEGNVDAKFQFNKKRGVLLYMYDVKHSVLPLPKPCEESLSSIPLLKGKVVVTETHTCSHYSLLMQTKGKRSVGMTVQADVPIPVVPAITASANLGFDISGSTNSDLLWERTKSAECDSFVPMYHLKAVPTGAPWGLSRIWAPSLVAYFTPPDGDMFGDAGLFTDGYSIQDSVGSSSLVQTEYEEPLLQDACPPWSDVDNYDSDEDVEDVDQSDVWKDGFFPTIQHSESSS